MAFTHSTSVNFLVIGVLLSIGCIQNVPSQSTKTFFNTKSVSWKGKSPFDKFWSTDSDKEGSNELTLLQLLNTLKNKNEAYQKIKSTDIISADAKLDSNISESSDSTSSVVKLEVLLKTSGDNELLEILSKAAEKEPASPSSNTKSRSVTNKDNKPSKFQELTLERHNLYRKKHRVPPLVFSKQISAVSQDWANKLAEKGEFKHRPNNRYGENLFSIWTTDRSYQMSPNTAVDSWYDEIKFYNYTLEKANNFEKIGHFTQLVWKDSKELGIGMAKSKSNKFIVVCNYSPPGNFIGSFVQNVLRP